MRLLFITDHDEAGGLTRNLQCLSNDGGNELTTVRDGIGLEHGQFSIIQRCKARRIFVREHGDDTRKPTRGARVDRPNPTPGNRTLNRERIRHAFDRVLESICCRASDLLGTIDAVQRCAYGSYGETQHWSSSSMRSSSVRTRMLRASWTLNALSRSGRASAAWRNVSSVASAPRSVTSACVARHGKCATPPKAMRASRTMPSATSSAAATETSANAYDARSRTLR